MASSGSLGPTDPLDLRSFFAESYEMLNLPAKGGMISWISRLFASALIDVILLLAKVAPTATEASPMPTLPLTSPAAPVAVVYLRVCLPASAISMLPKLHAWPASGDSIATSRSLPLTLPESDQPLRSPFCTVNFSMPASSFWPS